MTHYPHRYLVIALRAPALDASVIKPRRLLVSGASSLSVYEWATT
jgi:hypothetical protein